MVRWNYLGEGSPQMKGGNDRVHRAGAGRGAMSVWDRLWSAKCAAGPTDAQRAFMRRCGETWSRLGRPWYRVGRG